MTLIQRMAITQYEIWAAFHVKHTGVPLPAWGSTPKWEQNARIAAMGTTFMAARNSSDIMDAAGQEFMASMKRREHPEEHLDDARNLWRHMVDAGMREK